MNNLYGEKDRKRMDRKKRIVVRVAAFVLIAIMMSSVFQFSPTQHNQPPLTISNTAVTQIPGAAAGVVKGNSTLLPAISPVTHMNVMISLSYRNRGQLANFLTQVQNPHSGIYHRYLSRSQFISHYSPTSKEYDHFVQFFRSAGFDVTGTYTDHVSISLSGPASLFETVFHTSILEHQTSGRTFHAPSTAPWLSVNYGSISGIEGLSNQFTPHLAPMFQNISGGGQYVYGADMQTAYKLNQIYQSKGYPTNETIATILWSGYNINGTLVGPYVPSDISQYFANNLPAGEPKPSVYAYPINGAPAPGPNASQDTTGDDIESTLDLQMAGSTAPGATIIEVYGPQPTLANLDGAFASILNPNANATINTALSHVVAISNSWGSGDGVDNTWIQYEQQAAARGITVLVASGDNGNTPGPAPSYPATVGYNSYGSLAVGGTLTNLSGTQSTDGTNTTGINNQSVWFNSPNPGNGSQGGVSSYYAEPSWQIHSSDANTVITSNASVTGVTSGRGVPDVAGIGANMVMYLSNIYFVTGYMEIWGTSIASPLVAGEIASMDHYLGPPEGFMNPLVYRLGQAEYNGSYTGALPFYFITNGSNNHFKAAYGYDLADGWGSINAYNFVLDQQAGTKIVQQYNATFTETGLPVGAKWFVNITGIGSYSSTTSVITVTLQNGTFAYTYSSVNPYFSGSTGTLTVNGGSTSAILNFARLYALTFTETGLPSGTAWYMNISGMSPLSSSGPSISSHVLNGTYLYNARSSDKSYTAANRTGTAAITGSNLTVIIQFVELTYSTSFTETGLPAGTGWSVNITAMPAVSSTNSVITTQLANGTYSYSVYSTNPDFDAPGGTITVNGGSASAVIQFSSTVFTVTFHESGLPAGTEWYLNISGHTSMHTVNSSIVTALKNGNYSYSIGTTDKVYRASGGYFSVTGSPATVNFSFSSVSYVITFSESGLPANSTWIVNLSTGQSRSSASSTVIYDLTNGTYNYTVSSVDRDYATSAARGQITVNGNALTKTFVYAEVTYTITFFETGLPSGSLWYLNVSGLPSSGQISGSSFSMALDNGSYFYSASSLNSIYRSVAGNFSVFGSSRFVTVPFTLFTYQVQFNEIGLAPGTSWSVDLNGFTESSTGSSMIFNETNGTYNYSVTKVTGYNNVPGSGSITVNGASISVLINFTAKTASAYNVTFSESGLPPGTLWFANITGQSPLSSVSGSIFTALHNGTYAFRISTSDKTFTPVSRTGSFIVSGSSRTVTLIFVPVYYSVNFTESGLQSGTAWSLTLNGHTYTSNTPYISILKQNGTYTFSIQGVSGYTVSPASGSLNVNGANVSRNVTYTAKPPASYTITFVETGLPSGTVWWINITGMGPASSNNSTITFEFSNGTYTYNVSTDNPGYGATLLRSQFTVNGSPLSINIKFSSNTLPSYTIAFKENGLPSGTTWKVTISGYLHGGSYNTIYFTEHNGTYQFTVSPVAGYIVSPSKGLITVDGASTVEIITFTPVHHAAENYTIMFVENGLPSGTTWTVTLNGTVESSINNSIVFSVPNGTYSFTVGKVANYTSTPGSGSLSVQGAGDNQGVRFSHPPSASGNSLTPMEAVEILIITAIAAIGVAVAVRGRRKK